jgi:hypothetical protein
MRFNKLIELPHANTSEMRSYMAALLEVSGMMSGQGFELTAFMDNFRTHLAPKAGFPFATLRIETNGLVYLTAEGYQYFASRFTNAPITQGQHILRSTVIGYIRNIVAPLPPLGWATIEARLEEEVQSA